MKVDTSNILFICGGTFNGLHKVIQRRVSAKVMGFGAEVQAQGKNTVGETAPQARTRRPDKIWTDTGIFRPAARDRYPGRVERRDPDPDPAGA